MQSLESDIIPSAYYLIRYSYDYNHNCHWDIAGHPFIINANSLSYFLAFLLGKKELFTLSSTAITQNLTEK